MASGDLTFVMDEHDYNVLQRSLSQLSKVDQSNAIQGPLRQGATTIINAGKANLTARNKVKTGNLKRSFALKVDKKKSAVYAGFRRSAPRKGISGGNHAHLIDRGTTIRYTKYKHPIYGTYRGSVSKNAPNKGSMFWTDAVGDNGEMIMNNLSNAIYDEINKIMSRR